jgi:hypothetical protein
MKTEIRTRVVEPDDAIDAAFALFAGILGNPEELPPEYEGATFRPVESVESVEPTRKEYSFEVRLRQPQGTLSQLPEIPRVLIEA